MKKLFPVFSFCLLFISCSKNEVYKQYQNLNQLWYLESAENLPVTLSEIRFIDFSLCKISKKLARNESAGCMASINDSEHGGLTLSYSMKPGNLLEITDVRSFPESFGEGISILVPVQTELKLKEELVGEWSYRIENNILILVNGLKTIVFERESLTFI
jgi:hypothetical protein